VCGSAIFQPALAGRPRVYCRQACRQRAYNRRLAAPPAPRLTRDDWWTPASVRTEVLSRWPVKLDAAASAASAIVPEYLGPDHVDPLRRDALAVSWADLASDGTVYVNPPYSSTLLRRFLERSVSTAAAGVPVVGLVPASTSSLWWAKFITAPGAVVEFITGRLRFGGPHATGGPAPFGSALVYWSGISRQARDATS
jgi:hypothetical protein